MTHGGKAVRLGVDIGGTFTDVAMEIGRELFSTKILTNYTAPEQAILDGVARVAEKAGIGVDAIDFVIHGTCLLYTSPSPRDQRGSRMPSSA